MITITELINSSSLCCISNSLFHVSSGSATIPNVSHESKIWKFGKIRKTKHSSSLFNRYHHMKISTFLGFLRILFANKISTDANSTIGIYKTLNHLWQLPFQARQSRLLLRDRPVEVSNFFPLILIVFLFVFVS